MPLNLVYFSGGPRLAVFEAILEQGHKIERVYANDPARWPKVQTTIEAAKARNIPVTIISSKQDLSTLTSEISGKLCFSAGFTYLFPQKVIEAAEVILNVHGSLLPKYPGARTLSWAIEHGEKESGVTVHVVDKGMDTGAILLQKAFSLSPFETTRSLARKTAELEPSVVIEALQIYEDVGLSRVTAQPHSQIVLENRIPEHSKLDPNRPLRELVDAIRASDPEHYPAYFYHHGEKVCVRLWRPGKPEAEDDLV